MRAAAHAKRYMEKIVKKRKRKIGIWILSIILIISGINTLISLNVSFAEIPNYLILFNIFIATIFIIIGFGLIMLKEWIRKLTVYTFLPIMILYGYVIMFLSPKLYLKELIGSEILPTTSFSMATIFGILGIAGWGLIYLYYFTRPNVKECYNNNLITRQST
jgi:hypothetical protein